jgi:hypothetical protein
MSSKIIMFMKKYKITFSIIIIILLGLTIGLPIYFSLNKSNSSSSTDSSSSTETIVTKNEKTCFINPNTSVSIIPRNIPQTCNNDIDCSTKTGIKNITCGIKPQGYYCTSDGSFGQTCSIKQ